MLEGICKEYTHAKRTTMHYVLRRREREIHKTRLRWKRDRMKMCLVKAMNE